MTKYEVIYTVFSDDDDRSITIEADYACIETDGVLGFYILTPTKTDTKIVAAFKEWMYFRKAENVRNEMGLNS